jgi:hypothetical protein
MAMELRDLREDVTRVSVDTIADWQRIKNNYTEAAMASLDARITMGGLSQGEKDAILFHMKKVIQFSLIIVTFDPSHLSILVH